MSGWMATSTCLVFCETVCCTLIMNPSLLSCFSGLLFLKDFLRQQKMCIKLTACDQKKLAVHQNSLSLLWSYS